jgi:hypothetical protein
VPPQRVPGGALHRPIVSVELKIHVCNWKWPKRGSISRISAALVELSVKTSASVSRAKGLPVPRKGLDVLYSIIACCWWQLGQQWTPFGIAATSSSSSDASGAPAIQGLFSCAPTHPSALSLTFQALQGAGCWLGACSTSGTTYSSSSRDGWPTPRARAHQHHGAVPLCCCAVLELLSVLTFCCRCTTGGSLCSTQTTPKTKCW